MVFRQHYSVSEKPTSTLVAINERLDVAKSENGPERLLVNIVSVGHSCEEQLKCIADLELAFEWSVIRTSNTYDGFAKVT